ncbi:ribonuclease HII [bacterium (Candidatus Gribaldobacteria) CG07_land_8_20_14_0_80_33_18]|uniref:Ribonuclease HII n=1 Tax=bacterium (Candidatus Gribaldobacteria) CG07_land_8_20_14_0_80_33_18 TaxID=2014272 RepID=A0A2M6Z1X1_9BACT|nr:MAG: ribonuclease HII [bacterium (Candidatus Gribaldobacteria) CG10_big_fil_rev_8_21_14_0_10_33_41]PIU46373.1 MAG: ribonuclease HII [bacterium (Candidatus Gribaldobacteria) CG07_land_8_20_14_0_80_33_18]PJA00645.1 MAG: ribonuclease HII [bacterium (Candidatus Gribaldobacteria) CG_4_10_14_0_2_um_filter_33_15]PJB08470.1 MAG: ribonuclease HII [bacterium (Candidatus Gribaldobacteria) CG_4_9_14_3_um_filter_33_9]
MPKKKILNKIIVGIDEVGRGPLAGPVTAAAVTVRQIPNSKFQIPKIKDSKKLSSKKREELYQILTKHPRIEWGMGRVSEKVIDRINIKNAAELAMEKALQNLKSKIKIPKSQIFLIIDGNNIKNLKLKTYNLKLIIKGDEKVFSCAAASIIAKVRRDKIMKRYHQKYPQYGFDKHKGYGTKYHFKMLKKYGPCKIHRKTFRPVKNLKLLK